MTQPAHPKIFHIVHVDRLASIIAAGGLLADAQVSTKGASGTAIGMSEIKKRRLGLELSSHPALHVGECVPFYFCPRSVMLYLIYKTNHPDLSYRGGQAPIVHLEADLRETVAWAQREGHRWAFTLGNAGSRYFEDRAQLAELNEVDWAAVGAKNWKACRDAKQSEFLVESSFAWELVERVGVYSQKVCGDVQAALSKSTHKPRVEVLRSWYY